MKPAAVWRCGRRDGSLASGGLLQPRDRIGLDVGVARADVVGSHLVAKRHEVAVGHDRGGEKQGGAVAERKALVRCRESAGCRTERSGFRSSAKGNEGGLA